jgi:hypothetical protein
MNMASFDGPIHVDFALRAPYVRRNGTCMISLPPKQNGQRGR